MSTNRAHGAIIRETAAKYGFDDVRFAAVDEAAGIASYDRFLAEGRHGEMGWMERSRQPRADPGALLPDIRSVVVLGMRYWHPTPPDPGGLTGRVSRYAWGRDYHNFIMKRLRRLSRELRTVLPGLTTYCGVDSRPIIERAWAKKAGLGFIGKNAMAILPGQTSYFFIAAMLVNIELTPDAALGDHCGTCARCITGCPTDAFTAPGELDARRCISYLTIEHRGVISDDLKVKMGRWVFGCDVCQEVCPHNPSEEEGEKMQAFAPSSDHAWLDLDWILRASDAAIRAKFVGSPIRRAGPNGLRRNAAIAMGNIGDPAGLGALRAAEHINDPALEDAVQWAIGRL